VPRDSHSEQALKDVSDLSKPIRSELEKFQLANKASDEHPHRTDRGKPAITITFARKKKRVRGTVLFGALLPKAMLVAKPAKYQTAANRRSLRTSIGLDQTKRMVPFLR
jgi:hypothetical protein